MNRTSTGCLAPFMALLLSVVSRAATSAGALSWEVQANPSYQFFDDDDIADAIQLVYIVSNTSEPGDANNLVSFTVNAGTGQGVYNAAAPDGWLVSISDTRTTFTGNGCFIAPNGGGTFHLYGNVPHFTQGTASADSWGEGSFPVRDVLIPASGPPVCVLTVARASGVVAEGITNRVTLSVASTNLPAFRILHRLSLASGDWTPLGTYTVIGDVTQVVDTNTAPTRLYQAVSP